MSTFVTYFFQGEPGESQDCPNAFTIPAANVTFDLFLRNFPPTRSDARAKCHFRFCTRDKTHEYVWMDVAAKDTVLPLYNGVVCAKVLRIDSINSCKQYTRLRRKVNLNNGQEGANEARKIKQDKRQHSAPIESQDMTNNSTVKQTSQSIQQHEISANKQKPSPATAPVPDLFDFDAVSPNKETKTQLFSADAFAYENTNTNESSAGAAAQAHSVAASVPVQPILDRAELIAKREAQLEENVQRALTEKQERDDMLKKESDGMEIARSKHDSNLSEWAFDASKKKRNIRTLLTTMQKVLWEGNKWTPIGLADVLQPKQVKMKYRKAMLVVHPDHLSTESPEVRFIAKRIFEAINEQWQEFLKTESVE